MVSHNTSIEMEVDITLIFSISTQSIFFKLTSTFSPTFLVLYVLFVTEDVSILSLYAIVGKVRKYNHINKRNTLIIPIPNVSFISLHSNILILWDRIINLFFRLENWGTLSKELIFKTITVSKRKNQRLKYFKARARCRK